MKSPDLLLEIENLCVEFGLQKGIAKVINHLNLYVNRNETLGIVGESGCGKSMTALAILGMVPVPPGRTASGSIMYKGEDLARAEQCPFAAGQRQKHHNDLSGANDFTQPSLHGRRTDCRNLALPSKNASQRGNGKGCFYATNCVYPVTGSGRQAMSV